MDEIKNYYNEDLKIYRDCLKKKKIDFKKLIKYFSMVIGKLLLTRPVLSSVSPATKILFSKFFLGSIFQPQKLI